MRQVKKVNNSQQMVTALQKQDLVQADHYLEEALKQDTADELLDLAEYLESIGFFPQVKKIYEKLAPLYPEAYIGLAMIASDEGDLEKAFAYLEEIQSDSDWYATALLTKADFYQMEGLADVAKEKLLEATQLSADPIILFALAEIDFELGNFSQAIKNYAQLDHQEIYKQTGISTYQRIGASYASLGKMEVAIEFLEKSVELEYDDATVYELAIIFYDQEEYQKANLYFKQLDTISPEFEGYEYGYALSLHAEHKIDQALEIAKQGLAKNPFNTRLLLLASQYSYELHDVESAENYLLEAQKDAEDLEEITLRLTNLYLEQERYDDIVAFEDDDIQNVLTRWNIARAYYLLDNLEKAEVAYRELAPDLQKNPEFLEQYIYLLRELGDFETAKRQAKRYIDLVPDDGAMQDFYDSL